MQARLGTITPPGGQQTCRPILAVLQHYPPVGANSVTIASVQVCAVKGAGKKRANQQASGMGQPSVSTPAT